MSQHKEDPPAPPASLLPMHAVALDADGRVLKTRRRPGRPRLVARAPDADELDYIQETNERRREHVAVDGLVRAIDRQDPKEILFAAEVALAHEAASLLFEIEHGEAEGKDVAQLHSRRIDALCKLAAIMLGRRRVFSGELEDGALPKIATAFLATVNEVLGQTLGKDRAELLMGEIRMRADVGLSALVAR